MIVMIIIMIIDTLVTHHSLINGWFWLWFFIWAFNSNQRLYIIVSFSFFNDILVRMTKTSKTDMKSKCNALLQLIHIYLREGNQIFARPNLTSHRNHDFQMNKLYLIENYHIHCKIFWPYRLMSLVKYLLRYNKTYLSY